MNKLSDKTVFATSPEQLNSRLGEEMAILDLRSGVYFGLNPVAARVYDLIQQGTTIGAIRSALLNEFDVQADVLDRDLYELFEAMQAQGLLSLTLAA